MVRYFENIEVGETYEHGSRTVTKAEIVEFAEDDPTVGHVDSKLTGYNQDDEPVISWVGLGMVERRGGGC